MNYIDILNNEKVIENYNVIDRINPYPFNHGLKHVKDVCKIMDNLCNTLGIADDEKEDLLIKNIYHLNELRIEKEELEKKKLNGLDLKWLKDYKKIGKLSFVDRNIISKFINNIYIDNDKNIKIEFKYKDQYEDVIRYL